MLDTLKFKIHIIKDGITLAVRFFTSMIANYVGTMITRHMP